MSKTVPLKKIGVFWTYRTEDLQKAFFRDWGQYWNFQADNCDAAIEIFDQLPTE